MTCYEASLLWGNSWKMKPWAPVVTPPLDVQYVSVWRLVKVTSHHRDVSIFHLTSVSASSGLWRASLVTSHDAVWCACATHSTCVIVAWRGSLVWRTSANRIPLIIAQTSRRYIATSRRFMLWAGEFYAIPCGLTSNWNRIYYYSRIYFVARRHRNAIIGM